MSGRVYSLKDRHDSLLLWPHGCLSLHPNSVSLSKDHRTAHPIPFANVPIVLGVRLLLKVKAFPGVWSWLLRISVTAFRALMFYRI